MLESNCMSSLKYFVVVDSIDIADDLKSRSIVVAEMPGHLIIFKSDSAVIDRGSVVSETDTTSQARWRHHFVLRTEC